MAKQNECLWEHLHTRKHNQVEIKLLFCYVVNGFWLRIASVVFCLLFGGFLLFGECRQFGATVKVIVTQNKSADYVECELCVCLSTSYSFHSNQDSNQDSNENDTVFSERGREIVRERRVTESLPAKLNMERTNDIRILPTKPYCSKK